MTPSRLTLVPPLPPHDPTTPAADAGPPDDRHRFTITEPPETDPDPTHGYGVHCQVCGLELVPCVDLVDREPVVGLFLAGSTREEYEPSRHGRCPGPPARCGAAS